MKVQRVYIDTSVIGGCLDHEFAIWSKGLLRDFQEGNLLLVVSTIVTAEVTAAYEAVQMQYEDFLAVNPEVLEVTEQAILLAEAYQQRKILTPKYYADGLHIAVATVAEVDVLVSWNFKHIVHFNKIRLFNAANLEMGYKPIQIYSPREVTTYGTD
jgi:predicted nucleic acid-binding protein